MTTNFGSPEKAFIGAVVPQKRKLIFCPSLNVLIDLLCAVDILMVPLSGLFSIWIFRERLGDDMLMKHVAACLIGFLIAIFVFTSLNPYKQYRKDHWGEGLLVTLASAFVLFGVLIAGAFLIKISEDYSRLWAVTWMGLLVVILLSLHLTLHQWVNAGRAQGYFKSHVAVVGTGPRAVQLVQQLRRNDDRTMELVGIFGDGDSNGVMTAVGDVEDLIAYARRFRVDEVFLALPWQSRERVNAIVDELRGLAVNVWLDLEGLEHYTAWPSFRRVGEATMLRVERSPLTDRQLLLKSMEDFTFASLLLVALGPLMLLIALGIKLTSPGPVLFKQKRFGFNNNVVDVFKFRTMYVEQSDFDAAQQTRRDDARITPLGRILRRTSMDELPQLFNVIRGDMSLVGPRPHAVGMRTMQKLCHEIVSDYARRHRVKPGITGWAQINGYRGAVEDEEHLRKRVENDLFYIDNWSLSLDIKILFLTLVRSFFDKNAF